jgi:hypothetical protein
MHKPQGALGMGDYVQENELLALLIVVGVVVFALLNRVRLQSLPAYRFLWGGFSLLALGGVLTVLEGLPADPKIGAFLNVAEHVCYLLSSVLAAAWCVVVFAAGRSGAHEPDRPD